MGHNKDIKHHKCRHAGENLELFPTSSGKASVAGEILKSRWIHTAAELNESKVSSAASGKFYDQKIAVFRHEQNHRPVRFFWQRKFYKIDEIIGTWVLENHWWSGSKKQNRCYFRVTARGGTYDIYFDRLKEEWYLESVSD